jgi:hypothetical protein
MLEKWVGLILFFFLAMGVLEVRMGHASISLPKPSFDGKVSVEKPLRRDEPFEILKKELSPLLIFRNSYGLRRGSQIQ